MKDIEIVELAVNSIVHRSLRSWLAILGIVIGVASIVSLISISTGASASMTASLGGLGSSIITVSPGNSQAMRFGGPPGGADAGGAGAQASATKPVTFTNANSLRHLAGVGKVDARVSGNARIAYAGKNSSVSVIGVEPAAFPASSGAIMASGRNLGASDTASAVIGAGVETDIFQQSMLNKQVKIGSDTFRVIGVLNKTGSSFSSVDRSIFISQKAAMQMFNKTDSSAVSSIVILAQSGYNVDAVAASVNATLIQVRHATVKNPGFSITTPTTIQATVSAVTSTMGLLLGGIASISLLVGGVGVANAMFTSVLEQTRYIGILKALGAKHKHILKLFLYESALVGLVGGLLGIILSLFASAILSAFSVPSIVSVDLMALGVGFSVVIGIVSGLIPARNAARIEPVEALRYE